VNRALSSTFRATESDRLTSLCVPDDETRHESPACFALRIPVHFKRNRKSRQNFGTGGKRKSHSRGHHGEKSRKSRAINDMTSTVWAFLAILFAASVWSSEVDSGSSLWRRAMKAKRRGDYSETAELLEEAAKLGHAAAAATMGVMYQEGQGVSKNHASALSFFTAAAVAGQPHAMGMVAKYYYEGLGTERNLTQAFHWYHEAALHGILDALFMLGMCYHQGQGVPADKRAGFGWLQKGAEAGQLDSMAMLARCYLEGLGVEVDVQAAIGWLRTAAVREHPGAQFKLGTLLLKGMREIPADAESAISWLRKAAASGHSDAMAALAECYEVGRGVVADPVEALAWWNRAAGLAPAA
jgi:TPR repeat protein